MPADIIRDLGFLALGSRLKRIGEWLQNDVQRLCKARGIMVPVSLFPMLVAIAKNEEITVGDLALTLGVTQPGVSRSVVQLKKLRLIEITRKPGDQRSKFIRLSMKGRELVSNGEHNLWPAIEKAVAVMCAGLEGPLLRQLSDLEDELVRMPVDQRVLQTLG